MRGWLAVVVIAAWVAAPAAGRADGRALYDSKCAACHGKDGKGDTKMGKKLGAPDLTDAAVQDAIADQRIAEYVRERVPKLTTSEICQLVHVVRAFVGRTASCKPERRLPARLPGD